jgi:fructose-bisphosphate aldolase class I
MDPKQYQKIKQAPGFIAALDQSGGSTPAALAKFGIAEVAYKTEAEMYDQVHAMRTRIIKSPSFSGEKVIGAILFENTMRREIDGLATADYLWQQKGIVPFLKCDKGLDEEKDQAQCLKPLPDLEVLLEEAIAANIFGTKMRSVIHAANPKGISAVVKQQFELGKRILATGLIPIIEPEVTITISDKADAEDMLLQEILTELDNLADGQEIMLKLALPEKANQYQKLVEHPKVLRVVALSGGYPLTEAVARLSQNQGMIASFSRALSEPLSAQQSDAEFDSTMATTVDTISAASNS